MRSGTAAKCSGSFRSFSPATCGRGTTRSSSAMTFPRASASRTLSPLAERISHSSRSPSACRRPMLPSSRNCLRRVRAWTASSLHSTARDGSALPSTEEDVWDLRRQAIEEIEEIEEPSSISSIASQSSTRGVFPPPALSAAKISCMRSMIVEKLSSKGMSRSLLIQETAKNATKVTSSPMMAKRIVWTAFLILSSLPAEDERDAANDDKRRDTGWRQRSMRVR